jgi:hypothetical protein
MKIVVAQALPPPEMASALSQALAQRYPPLIEWFNQRQAKQTVWSLRQHGCTATEGLHLQSLGYQPETSTPIGAGLAPLVAEITATEDPVWIAALCSTQVRQEGATLIAQDQLQISQTDRAALTEAARPCFEDNDDGIRIEPLPNGQWRVYGPWPSGSPTISPNALLGRDLGDWWPTTAAWRPWRKRVNELQMIWHDHPVNASRQAQGLLPVNSVWLYGGARGFTPQADPALTWLDSLTQASLQNDWASWLDAWEPLAAILRQTANDKAVVLTDEHRVVELTPGRTHWWRRLTGQRPKQDWRHWWNSPN